MKIANRLVNLFRKKNKDQIASLTAADWIANMIDAVTERARNWNPAGSTPQQLAYFTIMESIVTLGNLLHLVPVSVPVLGSILLELRLYFDCLWQINLLNRFPDHNKVADLYTWVAIDEEKHWKAIFFSNPRISALLDCVIQGYCRKRLLAAVSTYIHGERAAAQIEFIKKMYGRTKELRKEEDNYIFEIVVLLWFQILSIFERSDIKISDDQLMSIVSRLYADTVHSLSNKFLIEFDLDKCQVEELPPEFYEK